jgi:MFS family permease
LTFSLLIFQGFLGGLAANPWQNMLAKVIPGEIRGTFFGVVNGSSNMMASLGALLSGFLLEKYFFPSNFAICFFMSFILYLISYTCLGLTREPDRVVDEVHPQIKVNQKALISQILRLDHRFTGFLITRFLYQFGMMALAYYTVFVSKELLISTITIGALTATLLIVQVVSNPVLGWLSDRWGKRNAFVFGSLSAGISALLAALAQEPWVFFLVFLFMGIANSAYWTIGIAYSLEFGDESQKPTYVGLSNTLVSPAILIAPLLGGWLANMGGYRLTFWISSLFALLTAVILVIFDKNSGIKEQNKVA